MCVCVCWGRGGGGGGGVFGGTTGGPFLRGLFLEGLIYGGKFGFKIDWASLTVGRKFTVVLLCI